MIARLALTGVVVLCAATEKSYAQFRSGPGLFTPRNKSTSSVTVPVAEAYQAEVDRVVKSPTLTTSYSEDPMPAHATLYHWMLEHPDRVSLAWQRLQVPCVEIEDIGQGRFRWVDEHGSELVWQTVGQLTDGLVWYASGKVRPAPVLPLITVRAVVVVRHPAGPPTAAGQETLQPQVQAYIQCDSRAANALLRMIGPAAPKLAEQGAEQLLYFFSGVARYLYKNPDKAQVVLAPARK